MQTFTNKIVRVPLSDIVIDLNNNVRDNDSEVKDLEYNLPPLIEDIATYGQTDPVTFEKIGDKFYPIRGFRRSLAISELAKANRTDPKTNKPFDSVAGYVFTDLSATERAELLVDHGQRKGLGKVGLFKAYEMLVDSGMSNERLIVVKLFTLLEQNYPPKRPIKPLHEDGGADALANWRGVIQIMKRAHEAPTVLREQFLRKLRGQQNWPTNGELNDMCDIHNRELAKNPALSRNNPGPEFTEKFEQTVKLKAEAAGQTRPKSAAQLSRQQNEEALKVTESLVCKIMQHRQLGNIDASKLADVDKIQMELEKTLPEEMKAKLLSILTQASKA